MNTPGLRSRIRDAYALFARLASYLQSPLLLALRVYWGLSFFQTGYGKFHKLDQITTYFASLGIPNPGLNALCVASIECFGGLLLVVGFASRLTAIPLIATMVVAYVTAEHEAAAAFFNDQDKFISSAPLTYLMVSLIVFAFGPGVFSIDYILGRIFGRPASAEAISSQ